MKVIDVYNAINEMAPFDGGFLWDNSGLICGDKDAPVTRVLTVLDADMAAYHKALEVGADCVVSHHPLIFDPIKCVTPDHPVFYFVKSGIAVISAHTCLDAAECGVSQTLAQAAALSDIEVMTEDSVNIGRIGKSSVQDAAAFADIIKAALPSSRCDYIASRPVSRVLCVGGAGGSELYAALSHGCDTLVTGECKHNHFIDAKNMGINLFAFGHFETENPTMARVAAHLRTSGLDVFEFTDNPPYERR